MRDTRDALDFHPVPPPQTTIYPTENQHSAELRVGDACVTTHICRTRIKQRCTHESRTRAVDEKSASEYEGWRKKRATPHPRRRTRPYLSSFLTRLDCYHSYKLLFFPSFTRFLYAFVTLPLHVAADGRVCNAAGHSLQRSRSDRPLPPAKTQHSSQTSFFSNHPTS